MDELTKDILQAAVWIVAVVGGLVTASKAVVELARANQQRRLDLRWRQAEMAKRCLDELFGHPEARSALKMLDWDGLTYATAGGFTQRITHQNRLDSLRTENTVFPAGDDAPFIRHAFDALFDNFERLEHFICIGLIRFEDVAEALRYYVAKLAKPSDRPVIENFLSAYDFRLAQDFLGRYGEWRSA
jgi:hypothetical protein